MHLTREEAQNIKRMPLFGPLYIVALISSKLEQKLELLIMAVYHVLLSNRIALQHFLW